MKTFQKVQEKHLANEPEIKSEASLLNINYEVLVVLLGLVYIEKIFFNIEPNLGNQDVTKNVKDTGISFTATVVID